MINIDKYKTSIEADSSPVCIVGGAGVDHFGCVLQVYSLTKHLEALGFKCEQINFKGKRNWNSPFKNFRDKYFNLTEPVWSYIHAELLNDRYNRVIAGSEPLFCEPSYAPGIGMLGWASGNKALISYASSFGGEFIAGTMTESAIKSLLNRFDSISVREDSGVKICNQLNLNAKQVVDATMLLEANDYQKIIDESDEDLSLPDKYVMLFDAYYLPTHLLHKIKSKFAQAGVELLVMQAYNQASYSPAQWLNAIKNAEYVITNSFHGTIFSLIFNKQILLISQELGSTRSDSLLRSVQLKRKKFLPDNLNPYLINEQNKIDYMNINETIKDLRYDSLTFLMDALKIKPSFKTDYISGLFNIDTNDNNYNPNVALIDNNRINSYIENKVFNVSMTTPLRDTLHFATDFLMEKMFFAYDTDDISVLKERKIARELLLANAKRYLEEDEFNKASKNPLFEMVPHDFYSFLIKSLREKHLNYFKERILKLSDTNVYFLMDMDCEFIYENVKECLSNLSPLAILYTNSIFEGEYDGIPTKNLLPTIYNLPEHPLICFTGHPMTPIRHLRTHGINWEVIPCAFA